MKMFDVGKTRMIRLPYGEKNYDDMLSRFHAIFQTDGQTDRQTDRRTVGQTELLYQLSRVSTLMTRDKNIIMTPSKVI